MQTFTTSILLVVSPCSPSGPGPPTMLQGIANTNPNESSSISFTWDTPIVTNGDILDYELMCVSQQGIPTLPTVNSPTTSATISNLKNGLMYCCNVRARNAQGLSMPSEVHCVTTVEIGMWACMQLLICVY